MKLTEWFPADAKPVHVGVYETQIFAFAGGPTAYKSYWTGKHWQYGKGEFAGQECTCQRRIWRGLAEKPE